MCAGIDDQFPIYNWYFSVIIGEMLTFVMPFHKPFIVECVLHCQPASPVIYAMLENLVGFVFKCIRTDSSLFSFY
jgi:hypothetical protein